MTCKTHLQLERTVSAAFNNCNPDFNEKEIINFQDLLEKWNNFSYPDLEHQKKIWRINEFSVYECLQKLGFKNGLIFLGRNLNPAIEVAGENFKDVSWLLAAGGEPIAPFLWQNFQQSPKTKSRTLFLQALANVLPPADFLPFLRLAFRKGEGNQKYLPETEYLILRFGDQELLEKLLQVYLDQMDNTDDSSYWDVVYTVAVINERSGHLNNELISEIEQKLQQARYYHPKPYDLWLQKLWNLTASADQVKTLPSEIVTEILGVIEKGNLENVGERGFWQCLEYLLVESKPGLSPDELSPQQISHLFQAPFYQKSYCDCSQTLPMLKKYLFQPAQEKKLAAVQEQLLDDFLASNKGSDFLPAFRELFLQAPNQTEIPQKLTEKVINANLKNKTKETVLELLQCEILRQNQILTKEHDLAGQKLVVQTVQNFVKAEQTAALDMKHHDLLIDFYRQLGAFPQAVTAMSNYWQNCPPIDFPNIVEMTAFATSGTTNNFLFFQKNPEKAAKFYRLHQNFFEDQKKLWQFFLLNPQGTDFVLEQLEKIALLPKTKNRQELSFDHFLEFGESVVQFKSDWERISPPQKQRFSKLLLTCLANLAPGAYNEAENYLKLLAVCGSQEDCSQILNLQKAAGRNLASAVITVAKIKKRQKTENGSQIVS